VKGPVEVSSLAAALRKRGTGGSVGGGTCATEHASVSTGSEITGAPAVSLGTLFVGTADGRLVSYQLPT
jgi:hypothetical protein